MITNSTSSLTPAVSIGRPRAAAWRIGAAATIGALCLTVAGAMSAAAYTGDDGVTPHQSVMAQFAGEVPPISIDVPDNRASGADEFVPVEAIPAPEDGRVRDTVAQIVHDYNGVPYKWGGTTPAAFDCSGLVMMAYSRVGVDLPHQSRAIRDSDLTKVISADEAEPGDIIWSPGHVAIYLGDDQQFEAHGYGTLAGVYKIWQKNPVFLRVI